jgi:DNA-binding NtrC family response regulator
MVPAVFIYSPNEMRGRIISETLRVKGIEARLAASHFEVETLIAEYPPKVIILDIKKNSAAETDFLVALSQKNTGAELIVLGNKPDPAALGPSALTNTRWIPGPLAPESIVSEVHAILVPKKN